MSIRELVGMLDKGACAPPDYRKWVALRDGRQVLLRPVTYADREALEAMFNRLGGDTRFLRFHYFKARLTLEDIEYYCGVDYFDRFALVAEIRRGDCPEIVGVGRYSRLTCGNSAEVAFVVEDCEQGNGIGTTLLAELARLARERGIDYFVGEMLSQNAVMLSVFRKFDPCLKLMVDGNSYCATLSTEPGRGAS